MTHPLGTMAPPTSDERQRAIVTFVWTVREVAGELERALGQAPDGSDGEIEDALQSARDCAQATSATQSERGPAAQAGRMLEIAARHLDTAYAHLRTHRAYRRLDDLADPPTALPAAKLAELCSKEREFAARAAKAGRRAAHVALTLFGEAWPQVIRHED